MKPRKLTIENIRSYRGHEPIAFSDAALIALLGNTGAGKSTLLDAIVLALYGKTIDSQLNLEDLIAPNESHMSVTLLFVVDGQEHEVHRLIRRRGGQGVHRLSKADGTVVTGSGEVSRAIEELLGLTRATFLSTVLLPQGRFADLLTAKPADRQAVFRDLFGLDQIDDVGKAANAELAGIELLRANTVGKRQMIAPNPSEQLPQIEAELAKATAAVARLEDVAKRAGAFAISLGALSAQRAELLETRRKLQDVGVTPAMVTAIRTTSAELDPQLARSEKDVETSASAVADAKAVVDGRVRYKVDATTLRTVKTSLDGLEHELREGRDDHRRLDEALKRLNEATEQLAACQAQASEVDAKYKPLKATEETLKREGEALSREIAQFADATRLRGLAVRTLDTETLKLETLKVAVTKAVTKLDTASVARSEAKATAENDAKALVDAERQDMAAAVAAHIHAGDACPVCDQTVPGAFVARVAPKLDDARTHAKASKNAFEAAELIFRNEERSKGIAEAGALEQQARVNTAQEAVAACDAALRSLAGKEKPEAHRKRLELAYGASTTKSAGAQAEVLEAATVVQAARDASTRAAADHISAVGNYEAAAQSCATRSAAIGKRIKVLPKAFAPGSDGADIEAVSAALQQALVSAERSENRLRDLQTALGTAQHAHATLQLKYAENVTRPLGHVIQGLNRLVALLALDTLPLDTPSDSPRVDAVFEALNVLEMTSKTNLAPLDEKIASETALRDELLAGIPGHDAPAALTQAKLDAQQLEIAFAAILKDVDLSVTLDRKLDAITPVSAALETVKQFMGVSYFKSYLAEQRAARVVAIGSRFLYDMTKRYQFAPNFDIQDLHNGTTRPSSSLSGGEKFLASLALSLAVVEQAAVGGAKIESLFLDEGFATLDAECLEVAMQELRSQARQGHAIWIITHLRDAAAYAHESYLVERTPDGSQVRLLDALPEDEPNSAGLLAVLS